MSSHEFGIITDQNDPTASLECVCHAGRLVGHNEGFLPATEEGFIISPKDDTPDHMHPWPDTGFVHALCSTCGRLYSDKEISETGKARVIKQVNFTSPEHLNNFEAYLHAQ